MFCTHIVREMSQYNFNEFSQFLTQESAEAQANEVYKDSRPLLAITGHAVTDKQGKVQASTLPNYCHQVCFKWGIKCDYLIDKTNP